MKRAVRVMTFAVALLATTAWAQTGTEISGTVKAVDRQANVVEFTDGRIVHLSPGREVISGGQRVTIETVRPGSTVIVRGPGASQTQVQPPAAGGGAVGATHPPVDASGVVASVDRQNRTITLQDGRTLKITDQSRVWQTGSLAGLQPGQPVLIDDAQPVAFGTGGTPSAMGPTMRMASVVGVDRGAGKVYLSDGTALRVSESTQVTMGGHTLRVTDLQPGDEVVVKVGNGAATTRRDGEAASALPRQEGGFYTTMLDADEVTIVRRPEAP